MGRPRVLQPDLSQPSGHLAHRSCNRTLRPADSDPARYRRRYTGGPTTSTSSVHDRYTTSSVRSSPRRAPGTPATFVNAARGASRPTRSVAGHGTARASLLSGDGRRALGHRLCGAVMGLRGPIRQPARPQARTRPARRPAGAARRRNRRPGCTACTSQASSSGARVTGQNGRRSAKQAVPRTAPSARTLSAICP